MDLFLAESIKKWYVVADDCRDVKTLVFKFENQFCTDTNSILQDLRGMSISLLKRKEMSFCVGGQETKTIRVSDLDEPRVIWAI